MRKKTLKDTKRHYLMCYNGSVENRQNKGRFFDVHD